MPFEEFKQKGGRARFGFPTITLLRSGGLSLNSAAHEELGKPNFVVLAYDKDDQLIGIRSATQQETHAYQARSTSDDAFWVAAQGFLKFHGLTPKATSRHRAELQDRYLVVDMKSQPVQVEKRKTN